ncbi:PepSY domain-containing protein [Starkeya koreensis]|uniref:PepSY domain-containing protein n=1 Tax=Ancylobacter koreensis TaxID=266121 RepID=A0ABT0DME8_9HYPH|nr:PepSY domain-containing protein [Ancylobacter koreensis]MCK0208307.1 PepSY domain-containing protein [Ancylobacter koreensis]
MTRLTPALAAALVLASPAFAQQAAIGIDEALVIVRANGMAVVAKLEHEHEKGVSKWEAEGLDAAGKKLEIEINAVDGKVISIK